MRFRLRDRRGFTLVEALVALVLSTLVIILVTSTFLAQNQFYSDVVARTSMQENARWAVALATAELRGVPSGGILAAAPDSVAYRAPIAVGGVCAVVGADVYVLVPRDGEGVLGPEVGGYAVRDSLDSGWTFIPATWSSILGSSGSGPAAACALAGADTAGATADYHRLVGLSGAPGARPGDLLMVYREMVLKLAPSVLEPGYTALFWGPAGGGLTEYATGLSPASTFQYRMSGQSGFLTQVTGAASLRVIDEVRIQAQGIAPASRADRDSLEFDLSASVRLRNVR